MKVLYIFFISFFFVIPLKSQNSNLIIQLKSGTTSSYRTKEVKSFVFNQSVPEKQVFLGLFNSASIMFQTSDIKKIYFGGFTGIKEMNGIQNLSLYPNPTTGNIHFKGLTEQNSQIQFFNLSGMMIFAAKMNPYVVSMDVSFLPKGIYLVRLNCQLIKLIKL